MKTRKKLQNIEEIYIKLSETTISKVKEEELAIPSISEETYKVSNDIKNKVQEQLKNIVVV